MAHSTYVISFLTQECINGLYKASDPSRDRAEAQMTPWDARVIASSVASRPFQSAAFEPCPSTIPTLATWTHVTEAQCISRNLKASNVR